MAERRQRHEPGRDWSDVGPIPGATRRRLAGRAACATDATAAGLALLGLIGLEPVAPVFGVSVVGIGRQLLPPLPAVRERYLADFGNPLGAVGAFSPVTYAEPTRVQRIAHRWRDTVVCPLEMVGEAWRLARRNALDRLAEATLAVGADAVVGVRVESAQRDRGRRCVEIVMAGTAVRRPGAARARWPEVSNLSVDDHLLLSTAGYEPAGLVAATAAVFVSPPLRTRVRRTRSIVQNQELVEYADGVRLAYESVRQRLQSDARDHRGDLVLATDISHTVERGEFALARSVRPQRTPGWHRGPLGLPYHVNGAGEVSRSGWVITVQALATAVRALSGGAVPQAPQIVVSLSTDSTRGRHCARVGTRVPTTPRHT
jgi:uncharacterized protein YbjQ (UPF0145 family)